MNNKGEDGGSTGFRTLMGVLIMVVLLVVLIILAYNWISGNIATGGTLFG